MGLFTRDTPSTDLQRATAGAYSAHRGLTAAATRINLRDRKTTEVLAARRNGTGWQDDAWLYYDAIGEVKYAFRLFTNVLSRIRLYAAIVEDEDEIPQSVKDSAISDEDKATINRVMRKVFSGASQPEILRKAGINMLVSGECYLVQLPAKFGVRDDEEWKIISISELETRNGKYYLKTERNHRQQDQEEIPESQFLGRIWNSHAQYSDEADSSMKALVEVCDDLFLYSRAGRAAARSRLNAGALLVPDTLSVSADSSIDAIPDDPDAPAPVIDEAVDEEFEEELMDGLSAPIADESSASAVMPVIIRGPREDLKEMRLLKFERSFDPQIAQRAERALERILQGIDMPKDLVTGLANIKYSNAVQIEESLYTSHVEPLVLLLCDAFRTVYLKPALRDAGLDLDLIDQLVIWYDPSAIMTAPDKSNAANVLHDKLAISNEALRRANGFAETDAPEDLEIAQRLAIQRGQLSEEITTELLKTIMPEILEAARQASQAGNPAPLPPGVQDVIGGPPQPPPDPTAGPQPPPIVQETDEPQPPPPISSP